MKLVLRLCAICSERCGECPYQSGFTAVAHESREFQNKLICTKQRNLVPANEVQE